MADGADANDKKAKAGEKDPKLKGKSTKSTTKQSTSSDSSTSDAIFACLQKIQASQKESEKQVTTLTERMDQFEKQPIHPVAGPSGSYYDDYSYGYFDDCYAEDETWEDDDTVPAKRPRVESLDDKSVLDSNSDMPVGSEHFSGLAKRFKNVENLGDDLDPALASNVSDLFLKGMNEEQYDKLVKDENTPRPSTCEGLRVVRMNKMIWDVLSPSARSNDLKLQKCAQSVVKAATILANTVNKLVGMEQDIKDKAEDINLCTIFEGCNDSLSLLGHANYLNCMARKDLLKNELKSEYKHLLTHAIPYTSQLFGDDVSTTAKDIEQSSRLGYRMQSYGGRGFRGRGNRGFHHGRPMRFRPRGRGYPTWTSTAPYPPEGAKNLQRRGATKSYRN